jgi:hypothetical protein
MLPAPCYGMATKEDLKEEAKRVAENTDAKTMIRDENESIYLRLENRCPIGADRLIRSKGWLVSVRTCDNEYLEVYKSYSPHNP